MPRIAGKEWQKPVFLLNTYPSAIGGRWKLKADTKGSEKIVKNDFQPKLQVRTETGSALGTPPYVKAREHDPELKPTAFFLVTGHALTKGALCTVCRVR